MSMKRNSGRWVNRKISKRTSVTAFEPNEGGRLNPNHRLPGDEAIDRKVLAQAKRIVERAKADEKKREVERQMRLAQPLVGKCFKYFNRSDTFGDSYSYTRIVAVRKGWKWADLLVDHIVAPGSTDGSMINGVLIERHGRGSANDGKLADEYQEITLEEYNLETGKILAKLGLVRIEDVELGGLRA